jgi:hypothetical protein
MAVPEPYRFPSMTDRRTCSAPRSWIQSKWVFTGCPTMSPPHTEKHFNTRATKSSSITTHSDQIALRYRISKGSPVRFFTLVRANLAHSSIAEFSYLVQRLEQLSAGSPICCLSLASPISLITRSEWDRIGSQVLAGLPRSLRRKKRIPRPAAPAK